MTKDVFLAGAARTAIGTFGGAFEQTPAPVLGSIVLKAALERAGVPHEEVDEVVFGNVVGAGLGQNVARQVTIGGGLASSVGATTVNKVCGSGLESVMLAAQAIQCRCGRDCRGRNGEHVTRAVLIGQSSWQR